MITAAASHDHGEYASAAASQKLHREGVILTSAYPPSAARLGPSAAFPACVPLAASRVPCSVMRRTLRTRPRGVSPRAAATAWPAVSKKATGCLAYLGGMRRSEETKHGGRAAVIHLPFPAPPSQSPQSKPNREATAHHTREGIVGPAKPRMSLDPPGAAVAGLWARTAAAARLLRGACLT